MAQKDSNMTGAHAALTPKEIKKAEKAAVKAAKKAQKEAKKNGIPEDVAVNAAARFADSGEVAIAPKRNVKKIVAIVFGIIFGILALIYAAGCIWFSSHFFPNSTFSNHDVSMESSEDFANNIEKRVSDYKFEVYGENCTYRLTVTGEEIDIKVDKDQLVKNACSQQNIWAWPYEIFQDHDVSDVVKASFKHDVLEQKVNESLEAYNPTAEVSVDAGIAYSEEAGLVKVTPHVQGKQIDPVTFLDTLTKKIEGVSSYYEITAVDFIKPNITSDDKRLATAAEKANTYLSGEIPLTMNGTTDAGKVSKKDIASWISLDENLEASLNPELFNQWAEAKAADMNTAGGTKTWTRADGKQCTVTGGVYGWKVDTTGFAETVLSKIENKDFSGIDIPCSQTADRYTPNGGRDFGAYVDVDIEEQKVRYYNENDELLYECDCVTGLPTAGRATPSGSYYLRAKQMNVTLVSSTKNEEGKPTYETPVKYWLPFIGNSIGLHDATWQPRFGGNRYLSGGSHGCVNLSTDDVHWFYDNLPVNICIITHH